MSSYALVIHVTPTTVEVGVSLQGLIVASLQLPHRETSKKLIYSLDTLLKNVSIQLTDCTYISSIVGPGAFTTLRAVVTTVNGLGYGSNLPLIGINRLLLHAQLLASRINKPIFLIEKAFFGEIYVASYNPVTHEHSYALVNAATWWHYHAHQMSKLYSTDIDREAYLENTSLSEKIMRPSFDLVLQDVATYSAQLWHLNEHTAELIPLYGISHTSPN